MAANTSVSFSGGCSVNTWPPQVLQDRKSTRLNSSHDQISYAVFCLKKKKETDRPGTQNCAGRDDAARRPEAEGESVPALGFGGMCEREEGERTDSPQQRAKLSHSTG